MNNKLIDEMAELIFQQHFNQNKTPSKKRLNRKSSLQFQPRKLSKVKRSASQKPSVVIKHLGQFQKQNIKHTNRPFFSGKSKLKRKISKNFIQSARKVIINGNCVFCNQSYCDARLSCAHPAHQQCLFKSQDIPLCRLCESKNNLSNQALF